MYKDNPEPGDDKKQKLEIRHYGTSPGSFMLYDDDGKTYNYMNGDFVWIPLKVTADSKGKLKGKAELPKENRGWSYDSFDFRFMSDKR